MRVLFKWCTISNDRHILGLWLFSQNFSLSYAVGIFSSLDAIKSNSLNFVLFVYKVIVQFYISGNQDDGPGDGDILRTLSSGHHRKFYPV